MSSWEQIVTALELPAGSQVAKRVPKKLLLERGAPTAADKRKIQDGIEAIHWLASLKPGNLNIRAHADTRYEYNEIAVLRVEFREKTKVGRLVELIHRAIPYPVILITESFKGKFSFHSRSNDAPRQRVANSSSSTASTRLG